jgi:acetyl-CoA carboxylase carboxyl transferase subunit alpha
MEFAKLDFEQPLFDLQQRIKELKKLDAEGEIDFRDEISALSDKLERMKEQVYSNLTIWQRVQVARHPGRPYTLDYIGQIFSDWIEFHGDRAFADDRAIVSGLARLEGCPVAVVGHQKGRSTKEKLEHNFGLPRPEGFRKARRVMELAARFELPIISFLDTTGAYPGIGSEERGVAEAIACNIRDMFTYPVPLIIVVIGEGGSGGALGIGVGDRVYMLENSYYSVITPEGCAAILWRDGGRAREAAEALKVSGPHLVELGIVDRILPEPLGGAHNGLVETAQIIKETLVTDLAELRKLSGDQLLDQRYQKFRGMGEFTTVRG